MNNWTKPYTIILIGIVFSIVAIYGICYFTIIKPLQEELVSIEQQVEMFEKRYETLTNQTKEESIDEELTNVAVKVPEEKSPDNVLLNIQTLATNANVVITSVSSAGTETDTDNNEEENTKVNSTIYSLEVVGENLDELNAFLDSILHSERLMVIDTMSLYQDEQSVEVSLTITTYYSGMKAG